MKATIDVPFLMSSKRIIRGVLIGFSILLLANCKVSLIGGNGLYGGTVRSETHRDGCFNKSSCIVEVVDQYFNENYYAKPSEGFRFYGWAKRDAGVCGGSTSDFCILSTEGLNKSPKLLSLLESKKTFYLEPIFIEDHQGGTTAVECFVGKTWKDRGAFEIEIIRTDNQGDIEFLGLHEQRAYPKKRVGNTLLRPITSKINFSEGMDYKFHSEMLVKVDIENSSATVYSEDSSLRMTSAPTVDTLITHDPPRLLRFDLNEGESYSQSRIETKTIDQDGTRHTQEFEVEETITYVGREKVRFKHTFRASSVCRFNQTRRVTVNDVATVYHSSFWHDPTWGIPLKSRVQDVTFFTPGEVAVWL